MKATVVPFRDSSLGGVERAETVSASPAWRSFARAPALTEVDPAGGIEVREQELVRVQAPPRADGDKQAVVTASVAE